MGDIIPEQQGVVEIVVFASGRVCDKPDGVITSLELRIVAYGHAGHIASVSDAVDRMAEVH